MPLNRRQLLQTTAAGAGLLVVGDLAGLSSRVAAAHPAGRSAFNGGRVTRVRALSGTYGALVPDWEFFQNVESALEGTRAEPGPIEHVRPEGVFYGPMEPAGVRDSAHIVDLPASYGRFSYPGVFFHKDRVIITHSNAHFDTDDKYVIPGRLKVLPISWLYAGAKNMKPDPQLKKMFPIRRD